MGGMRGREFVTLLGSAAVRQVAARAQPSGVGWAKACCSLHLRGQNRARAFAHADAARQSILPTLQRADEVIE